MSVVRKTLSARWAVSAHKASRVIQIRHMADASPAGQP